MDRHNECRSTAPAPDKIQLERERLLDGKPDRETAIGTDDLIDLQVALHKSTSLEDFLSRV